jgi:hypothetical protein
MAGSWQVFSKFLTVPLSAIIPPAVTIINHSEVYVCGTTIRLDIRNAARGYNSAPHVVRSRLVRFG